WQLPHHGRYRRIAYDPIGFLLALAMFVPFQYLVNEGERRDWFNDPNVTLAAIAFVVLAAIFAYWQRSAGRHPFIDVRILGNRNLVVGLAISAILNLAGYSTTLLIQYAQLDAGFSPTEAGIVVGVRIAGIALGVFATGALVIRGLTTPRTAFVVGTVAYLFGLFAVGNLMTSTEDLAAYLPLTIAVGLAQGVANQPLAPMIFGSVAAADLPMGLIFYKLAPQIGLSVGNALSQRMLDVVSAQRLSDLAGDVTLQNTAAAAFVQDGHASQLSSLVAGQAMTLAYGDVTRWLAVIGVAALVLVLFMRVAHRK
ncbi:MAG TPA: hypothetical protein VE591_13685, partial [Candidatus Acidoferrum sp.]|nr:hypothetical protein [Candidatus Acidoferrum sp.]